MRRKIFFSIIIVAFLIVLARSYTDETKSKEITYDESETIEVQTIRVRNAIETEIQNLDPAYHLSFDELSLFYNISETLIQLDSDGKIIPGLAEKWDISEDKLVYTFYLRDTKWSDGKKITSNDFYNRIKYILDKNTNSPFSYRLFPILNGKDFHEGLRESSDLGIKPIEENILEITLEKPDENILKLFSLPFFSPVRNDQGFQFRVTKEIYPKISSGKYFIDNSSEEGFILLKKNPHHYENKSEENHKDLLIELITIEDSQSRISAFQTGTVDIVSNIFLGNLNDPNLLDSTYKFMGYGNFYYIFNTSKYPFKNPYIRKLFNEQAETDLINDMLFKNNDFVSKDMSKARTSPDIYKTIEENLERRIQGIESSALNQEEMEEFKRYFSENRLRILSGTNEIETATAKALKEVLEKNLGISVQLDTYSLLNLREEEILSYDIISYYGEENLDTIIDVFEFWIRNYPDLISMNEGIVSAILERNSFGNNSEDLDLLMEIEFKSRTKYLFLPIYNKTRTHLIKSYIHGLDISKHGIILYDNIVIEK